jgi:flagellar basal body rod protein FlgG
MGVSLRLTGLSSAAAALRYWERRQEVTSNNLANVDTTGFKGERVFARLTEGALPEADTGTDTRGGTLRETGSPLDLALTGDGYLVVDTPAGERLTRGGSYHLEEDGRVADAAGNALLGESGPIVVPPGTAAVEVTGGGVVRAGGREVGRLRMEGVPPGTRLQHAGAGLFVPDASARPLDESARRDGRLVRQGYLEESNVSALDAMVDMISVQRAYAAVQKAVTTLDAVRGTAANELGKPV